MVFSSCTTVKKQHKVSTMPRMTVAAASGEAIPLGEASQAKLNRKISVLKRPSRILAVGRIFCREVIKAQDDTSLLARSR
jgi:hypothetical protein